MTFFGLRGHDYLGMNNVDNMSAMAEMKLTTTLYHGEQRRWNFELARQKK
jgi:UDP-N-acetylglucosamine pyrophosphorylase